MHDIISYHLISYHIICYGMASVLDRSALELIEELHRAVMARRKRRHTGHLTHTHRQTQIPTHIDKDRQTKSETDRQSQRQTDTETDRDRQR